MTGSTKKAPAGWYPHPKMPGTQRYWDGQHWTDHVAPMPQGKPVGVLTVARGVALGIVIVIAALFFFGNMIASSNQQDCEDENVDRVIDGRPLLDCS
jgi:hypothetical protein